MSVQECIDISEAVPLEASLGLYLKPASKIKISVQLPKLKTPGQSISTWQVMEKLKAAIRPDQFTLLRALKITSVVIKLEGELETRSSSERALARLNAVGGIKLSGFPEFLQIRAAHAACSGPTRHDWDSFFRDARGVDEMKPGERPDTVHLQELPSRWFSESSKVIKPSERLLHKVFNSFGRIRRLEIPEKLNSNDVQPFGKTSSLFKDVTFQVYIQYEQYVEFATAMDSLRGKKLVFKDPSEGKVYSTDIKVDFDKTRYLSDKNIKKRSLEVKKLLGIPIENDECKIEKNSSVNEETLVEKEVCSHLNDNKEHLKETSLLLKELFHRVEASEKAKEKEKKKKPEANSLARNTSLDKKQETKKRKEHLPSEKEEIKRKEKINQQKLLLQERILKEKLLKNLKAKEQLKIANHPENLRKKLSGHKLSSVLGSKHKKHLK